MNRPVVLVGADEFNNPDEALRARGYAGLAHGTSRPGNTLRAVLCGKRYGQRIRSKVRT